MQAGSAPCTPLEVAYAPSRPPPGPKAVLCRRLAACSTQVRAEPSAAAGSEFLAGVVWKHRLCRCWSDLCILHSAFARWARRNGHGATSGRAPRPVLRHKPVPAPGRPQAGGTVRASDLGGLGGEATQAGERGRQPAARRPTAPSGTPPRRGSGGGSPPQEGPPRQAGGSLPQEPGHGGSATRRGGSPLHPRKSRLRRVPHRRQPPLLLQVLNPRRDRLGGDQRGRRAP
jgi:hypothetical protein